MPTEEEVTRLQLVIEDYARICKHYADELRDLRRKNSAMEELLDTLGWEQHASN